MGAGRIVATWVCDRRCARGTVGSGRIVVVGTYDRFMYVVTIRELNARNSDRGAWKLIPVVGIIFGTGEVL